MLRNLLWITMLLATSLGVFAQSGSIKGKVFDKSNNEPIPFANVVVEQNGTLVGGGTTDFDGNYNIKPVPAGKFTVKVSCIGYASLQYNDVVVFNEKVRFLDLGIETSTKEIEEVTVVSYKVPLIEKDNTQTGGTVTSEDISKMSGRSAESVAATVGGVYQENGQIQSVRGSRSDGTVYYIDGVKVRGSSSVPKSSIEQISVVTGGLAAKYGDATGGIISITTKGAARETQGGIELVTSKFLDPYNDNLVGLNISGPLYSKKSIDPYDSTKIKKTPVIGYFLSGEFTYVGDDDPAVNGLYKVKDDILDSIKRNPIRPAGGIVTNLNAEFLRAEHFEKVKVRQNVENMGVNLQGKFDFAISKTANLTLGANLSYNKQHGFISPEGNMSFISDRYQTGYANHLFNWENFPEFKAMDGRVFLRMSQRFANAEQSKDEAADASLIKNVFYTIQADYTKQTRLLQDDTHKDEFFNYGYVGKFKTYKIPTYQYGTYVDETTGKVYNGFLQDQFQDTLVTFQRSEINPELANYTDRYYGLFNNNEPYRNNILLQTGGALLNGDKPKSIYNIAASPGEQYDEFYKNNNDQIRISGEASADIADHALTIGFEYEQRIDRFYSIEPVGLWTEARSLMNFHLAQLNFADPIIGYVRDADGNLITDQNGNPIFNDTVSFNRVYSRETQATFDLNFRKNNVDENGNPLAMDGTNWVDIDNYDPSKLKVDYFSADELLKGGNSGNIVEYFGYDYKGNVKLFDNPSFEDFFTDYYVDEMGRSILKREIAPFQPVYFAGYLMDKFAFNDLVFNVGLRVDMFDANQKVLKDKYLMFETYKVGDDHPLLRNTNVPSNIGDGASVYVDSKTDPREVVGYRVGSVWYNASGAEIADPSEIFTATGIAPLLVDKSDSIGSQYFLRTFTDYTPQWNLSPRISFSFPISDVAGFFAHYDIYTKRPTSGIRLNPASFLNVKSNVGGIMNNPGLKPERTVDYEIGFQQKIGNSAALKLSAFYREMRDQVQLINVTGAYPVTYKTYGNIDFGTVKGFTVSYDLRRTGNVRFLGSYTLQFANGTGSDATTAFNLLANGQPNLRSTLPYNFDQRHSISFNVDYHYGEGKDYNGPKLFGINILENAGANFTVQTGSGSPFTRRTYGAEQVIGSVNGSSKPWRTTVNMKIDKDIVLEFGKGEDGNQKTAILNVYLDISNLLNAVTILDVYSTSGNAGDDGYLSYDPYKVLVDEQLDPTSFVNYRQMLIDDPSRYGSPRQIRLGALFQF